MLNNSNKYMTQEGRKNLEDELFLLENNMRKMVAEAISNASETGGILENAEYESAKNEQSFLEGRISEIKQILSTLSAVPVNQSNKKDRKSVEFGSTITLKPQSNKNSRKTYQLVSSAEANPAQGLISVESPVGKAALGKMVGDEITVNTPSGESKFNIVKIKQT
ncbi:MAG: transcription elongation factor GreA [Chloroflexi bacterium]|nr:transcription elongation factor GreA [Chloroflexota bacterium]